MAIDLNDFMREVGKTSLQKKIHDITNPAPKDKESAQVMGTLSEQGFGLDHLALLILQKQRGDKVDPQISMHADFISSGLESTKIPEMNRDAIEEFVVQVRNIAKRYHEQEKKNPDVLVTANALQETRTRMRTAGS